MPTSPNNHTDLVNEFRQQMPVAQAWAYLDHAAVAPISAPAQQAIGKWLTQAAEQGVTVWADWSRRVEQVRDSAARLIGAQPKEVALVANTTAGISLVAEGYPWQEGDNLVTLSDEFPSNQYPWMNLQSRGVQVRRVSTVDGRLDLNHLEEACDERTRLISISWVGYANGCRRDLGAVSQLVHRNGALIMVDAIQGLGAFPIDVEAAGIDFLAADGHKWLLGPEGAGLLYVRGEHLDRLRPLGLGWNSVVHANDFSRIELHLKSTAARYEGGTLNMAGFLGLGASLDLLQRLGIEKIADQVLAISDLACQHLTQVGARIVSPRDRDERSGIVAFSMPGIEPADVRQHGLAHGVALSCRGGCLRISPHAYNNLQDIERLVDVVRTVGRRR